MPSRAWPSAFHVAGRPTVFAGLLVVALLATWFVHPFAGPFIAVLAIGTLVRPLDPLFAIVLTAAVATFVNNEGGRLTRELSIVTALMLHAGFCTLVAWREGLWRLPDTPLLRPLALVLVSALISTAHGLAAGSSLRYLGLELLPLLVLASVLVVGGLRLSERDLRLVFGVLVVAGLVHVVLGIYSYQVNGIRTGGLWYTPMPGMLSGLTLHLALREKRAPQRMGLTLLTGLLLLHQVISFSRGYWLGLLVALPWTVIRYGGRGPGAAERWRSIQQVTVISVLVAAFVAVAVGSWFGWTDLWSMLGTRFGSSFSSKQASESASNVSRIVEYIAAAGYIRQSPWFGHGLGMEMLVKQPIWGLTSRQWFMHHGYLLTWVKQGLFGLIAMLWLLWTGFRVSDRFAARREEPGSAWAAGAASATLYLLIVNLTTFHMAQVNSPTLEATLWGIVVALQVPRRYRIVWRQPAPVVAEAKLS